MSEEKVIPLPEEAVLDPALFLMRKENVAYLKGQRATPLLEPMAQAQRLRVTLFAMLAGLFGVAVIYSAVALVQMGRLALFVSTMAIFAFGAVLAYTIYTLLKQRALPQSGTIVAGEIVQADRVWLPGNRFIIGVRYRFSAPNGDVLYGVSEGFADAATEPIAPLPGTPVYIYFIEAGTHYLL